MNYVNVYIFLYLVRLVFVLNFSTSSYVHPDEHFQCGEVISSLLHSSSSDAGGAAFYHVPWEYNKSLLSRSLVSPEILCGVPQRLGIPPNVWQVVLVLIFHEYIAVRIMELLFPQDLVTQLQSLIVRSSSWVCIVMLSKTFSNTLECLCFDLLVLCFLQLNERNYKAIGMLGGFVFTLGCFVRITFPAFALPILFAAIKKLYENNKKAVSLIVGFVFFACFSGLVFAFFPIVWLDSKFASSYVLAPLNNLLYNMNSENLKQHGLHPRWTHLVVNLQILFGPMVLYRLFALAKQRVKANVFDLVLLLSVLVLSIFPHQEFRFLTPLLLPVSTLSGKVLFLRNGKPTTRVLFFWFVFNFLMVLMFGIFHQGGIIQVLHALNERFINNNTNRSSSNTTICLAGYKLYPLPRYVFNYSVLNSTLKVFDVPSMDELKRFLTIPGGAAAMQCGGGKYLITTSEFSIPKENSADFSRIMSHPFHFNAEAGGFRSLIVYKQIN